MYTSPERQRENCLAIMMGNIDRDSLGKRLTPEAQQQAAEFALKVWKGNMGNGTAAQIGIQHVLGGNIDSQR